MPTSLDGHKPGIRRHRYLTAGLRGARARQVCRRRHLAPYRERSGRSGPHRDIALLPGLSSNGSPRSPDGLNAGLAVRTVSNRNTIDLSEGAMGRARKPCVIGHTDVRWTGPPQFLPQCTTDTDQ